MILISLFIIVPQGLHATDCDDEKAACIVNNGCNRKPTETEREACKIACHNEVYVPCILNRLSCTKCHSALLPKSKHLLFKKRDYKKDYLLSKITKKENNNVQQ